MKAFLMYRDRDFDPEREPPWNEQDLTQDLELNTLFNAMARGDKFLFNVARSALLTSRDTDMDTIRYRQDILKDCLNNAAIVRRLYQIPISSIENKQKRWLGIFSRYPSGILSSAVEMMQMFVGLLKELRHIAGDHAHQFQSEGFTTFFTMIQEELDDDYFALIEEHLRELRFARGVLISAELGQGNEGTNYVLRRPNRPQKSAVERLFGPRPPSYTFHIHPRDQHGARALSEFRDRGINLIANALAQSADHIDSFFTMLRIEMAFYIGCLNLAEKLAELEEPITFPLATAPHERQHSFTELYDVCLALTLNRKVVGNDIVAAGKELIVITGANQGGKSTFLRSIGLAQLMMECGMFVPAASFSANLCDGLFTHYRREEDTTMESGKLDEELGRMSLIVDHLRPDSLLLLNESFSATNEREGSEIARQIVSALVERGIKVFFVTHLYTLARGFYDRDQAGALFLCAEREADGTRTFKLAEGKPLETSFGEDLYRQLFETEAAAGANGQQRVVPENRLRVSDDDTARES
jgi:hypothetical protein